MGIEPSVVDFIDRAYKTVLEASVQASKRIMHIYDTNSLNTTQKLDGSLVTHADLVSAKIISEYLHKLGIPIVDEESDIVSYDERKKWKYLWLVDPLDGTYEFVKRSNEFVVNIALIHLGKPIFGAITSPVLKKIIFGGKTFGVFLCDFDNVNNPKTWITLGDKKSRLDNRSIVVISSHTRYNSAEEVLINKLKKHAKLSFIRKGSALKFFDLAKGTADIYPRFAPSMEWDIAAGQAIIEALGGQILNAYTKKTLHYNKKNLLNPDFIVTTKNAIFQFDRLV